ncbi:MAG: amidophosphoribosyltransferase, partial [Deltaproteobacteria bacterium]|nr:amidophosphoribosyltransferase [Deltaproteobacteria bacterium]
PPGADIVIPVPDSGTSAAIGFAEQSGVKFDIGMIRSHYVGRTFIEPETRIRHFGVKLKLNPVDSMIRGKSVVVVDDSIVRGTTSRKIINMIKTHEPREVHLRISSPPTSWPCFYGIDTPTREELIASSKSVGEISEFIGCTSLGYLSIEGMHKAVNSKGGGYCDACFSGNYPIPVELNPPKRKQMRLFEEM